MISDRTVLARAAMEGRLWQEPGDAGPPPETRAYYIYDTAAPDSSKTLVDLCAVEELMGQSLFLELRPFEEGNHRHKVVPRRRDHSRKTIWKGEQNDPS